MASFDYISSRATADRLIQLFGMPAVLRRMSDVSPDRICWVVIPEYMPRDAQSQMANPTERQVFISAGLGDVPTRPPDNELDQLVTFVQPGGTIEDEVLPFTGSPVKPIKPAGIVVVYQATVRR